MLRLMAFSVFVACLTLAGRGVYAAQPNVTTTLVVDHVRIAAGGTFRVGVLFKIPAHGHIYWSNPGESGLPTEIEWKLPEGFVVGDLLWPIPSAFRDDILNETTFGYEHEILLFAEAHAPETLSAGENVRISAKASWLVCLDDSSCIPETAAIETLLIAADKPALSSSTAIFDAFAARVPRPEANFSDVLRVEFTAIAPANLLVQTLGPWLPSNATGAVRVFFPDDGGRWGAGVVDHRDPHVIMFLAPGPIDARPAGALHLDLAGVNGGGPRSVYVRLDSVKQ